MLFVASTQFYIFLFMLFIGIAAGIFFECLAFINIITKQNKWVKHTTEFIFVIAFFVLYLGAINFCAYGQLRVFTVATTLLGFLIERLSIGYLVQKLCQAVYKQINKWYNKIALKFKK